MSLFQFIAQACQSLAATAAPTITAMGIHMVLALATIVMVWFGVQEALASAHGEAGFSMGRFLNLFMLLTFAYVMVNYLRQFHSRTWLFPQGLHRRRHDQSCESNWIRWFHHHAERDQCCIFQDRAWTAEYDDVPLLRDGVLCGAIPPGLVGRNRFRNRGLRRNCGDDHRIARARSLFRSLSSTSSIGCSGDGSRLISGSAFTKLWPQPL